MGIGVGAMGWYAAHLVMYSMFKDGIQDRFPIREDVVLIEAPTVEAAFAKARREGKAREGDDDGTHGFEGRPATRVFVGVRKLIECEFVNGAPGDGTEVSYSHFEVSDRAAVQLLAKGEPIAIQYRE